MGRFRLPTVYKNTSLKTGDGHSVYNTSYKDHNVIITPVVQRPSGQITYSWRFTHHSHINDSVPVESKRAALEDMIKAVDLLTSV